MSKEIKLRPKDVDNPNLEKQLLCAYECAIDFIRESRHKELYKEKMGSHDGVIYEHNGHVVYVYRTPTLIVSRVKSVP